jgi:hypothetical protein
MLLLKEQFSISKTELNVLMITFHLLKILRINAN